MCRREGENWLIAFAGESFRPKDVKGLSYLVQLLRHPGREFHVLDLAIHTGTFCAYSPDPRAPITWHT